MTAADRKQEDDDGGGGGTDRRSSVGGERERGERAAQINKWVMFYLADIEVVSPNQHIKQFFSFSQIYAFKS